MTTVTDICNAALLTLGADLIADIADDNERARLLGAVYDGVRDEVLAAHPWNCAIARRQLAAEAEPPLMDWRYQYALPSEPWCLRALRIDDRTSPFIVEGRRLLTDAAPPLGLVYIARVSDTGTYSPGLARAIAYRLAESVAVRLTNSRGAAEAMHQRYIEHLRQARSLDGQEGGAIDLPIESEFLQARL